MTNGTTSENSFHLPLNNSQIRRAKKVSANDDHILLIILILGVKVEMEKYRNKMKIEKKRTK